MLREALPDPNSLDAVIDPRTRPQLRAQLDGLYRLTDRYMRNLVEPRRPNAETTGRAILRGIKGDAPDSFTNRTAATADRLYSALDRAVPPDTPVPVTSVLGALDELNRPIPGAPTLSEELRNPKLTRIQQALATDAAGGTVP